MLKYKNTLYITFLIIITLQVSPLRAIVFKIIALDGTARIQKEQKKTWEDLSVGGTLKDNDIIETFFQTKLVLSYGFNNLILVGSNTRTLLNIKETKKDERISTDVNITVFSGGVLAKIVKDSRVGIYTSHAVAQIDSGTISTVVESKTNHSGFQVLAGSASIRNIEHQASKKITVGMTTVVLPGKEPTAALYMTDKHVTVLRHFFGNEFIDHEVEAAGIHPTESNVSANRLSFSQGLDNKAHQLDAHMYKKLFSLNSIYGSLLEDQQKNYIRYREIPKPHPFSNTKFELQTEIDLGQSGFGLYPIFSFHPLWYTRTSSYGLKLPIARTAKSALSLNINSFEGVLDKIHHFNYHSVDSTFFFNLGPIDHFTIADGLLVNHFSNKNYYSITQPLGVTFFKKKNQFTFEGFIANISSFGIGGFHLNYEISSVNFGLGYCYDANQYSQTITNNTSRFIDNENILSIPAQVPNAQLNPSHTNAYEINFNLKKNLNDEIIYSLAFQFSQKISSGIDGFVIAGPEFRIEQNNINYGLGYVSETGKLLYGHFNSMYMTNRLHIDHMTSDSVYYTTFNNMLSKARRSHGVTGYLQINPYYGTDLKISIKHDFFTVTPFSDYINGDFETDTINSNNNFNILITLRFNNMIYKPIKHGTLYLSQTQGGYYPKFARYLTSWGVSGGFSLMTIPLILKTTIETGVTFTYIDLFDSRAKKILNNNIDPGDYLVEYRVLLRRGIL